MQHAIDPSLMRLLRRGVETGLWTLESLDTPSNGFATCTAVDREHFRGGYEGVQFRNLLRDAPPAEERVRVIDDKDLPPMPTGITPAEPQDLPITLDEEEAATPSIPRQPVEASSQRETFEPEHDEADRSSPLFW